MFHFWTFVSSPGWNSILRYIAHSMGIIIAASFYWMLFTLTNTFCDWSTVVIFNNFIAKECEIANSNFPVKCDSFFCDVVRGQFSTVQCNVYCTVYNWLYRLIVCTNIYCPQYFYIQIIHSRKLYKFKNEAWDRIDCLPWSCH